MEDTHIMNLFLERSEDAIRSGDKWKSGTVRWNICSGEKGDFEQGTGSVSIHICFGEELKVIDQKWLLRTKYQPVP